MGSILITPAVLWIGYYHFKHELYCSFLKGESSTKQTGGETTSESQNDQQFPPNICGGPLLDSAAAYLLKQKPRTERSAGPDTLQEPCVVTAAVCHLQQDVNTPVN